MKEQWRDVIGYEGIYQVSSLGRVKRTLAARGARAGHILKPSVADRYPQVVLSRGGKTKNIRVHKLVAAAFLGSCPKGLIVNHKDTDKQNCAYTNLEYTTHAGNTQHAFALGLLGGCAKATITEAVARSIYASRAYPIKDIAERYSTTESIVAKIFRKKSWKHIHDA